jgi:sugar lactone lactonase YvrE
LVGHVSTSADAGFVAIVEGKQLLFRNADGSTKPFTIASDGIALSPDGTTLYYSPLTSRRLYSVPTTLLRDPTVSEEALAAAVIDLGDKGASDGLESDAAGNIYASDYEHNAIHRLDSRGRWSTVVQDPRVLWPDTLSIGPDGYLYFTANQLHRQAGFNAGVDMRQKPYVLYRTPAKAGPAPTR